MSYTLNSNLKSQLIVLDPRNAQQLNSDKKSDVLFTFTDQIIVPDYISILISLQQAVFPISFYVINENNNTLIIDSTTYVITQGNYTATSLISFLNTNVSNYTWQYSSITNKITITKSTDFTISSSSTCLSLLGFSASDQTSTSGILVSDKVVDLSGSNFLYVETNFLTQNLDTKTGTNSSILATIPINSSAGGVAFYTNYDGFKSLISDKVISYINIKIYDEDHANLIDFNNCNWFIQLRIDKIVIPKLDPSVIGFKTLHDTLNEIGKPDEDNILDNSIDDQNLPSSVEESK